MSIADKLTYLQTTKQLLKTEINKINNVLDENSTFRSYPQELFNGYLDILNNGTDTLWNNLEKVSASGETPVLENVETAPIKIVLNGNTNQETTTGKNLLSLTNGTYSHNGITAVVNDGTITITGTATANSFVNIPLIKDIVLSNEQVTASINNATTISDTATEFRVYESGTNYIPVLFTTINRKTTTTKTGTFVSAYVRTTSGVNYGSGLVIKPQLEYGSTATSWEKYTGGQPSPSPDYPQEVKVVKGNNVVSVSGKNLFDKDNATIIQGYFDYSRTSITSTSSNRTTYLKVKPNTTYSVSKLVSARSWLGTAQEIPTINTQVSNISNFSGGNYTYDGITRVNATITTGANDSYIVLNYTNTNSETGEIPTTILNSIQIEEGSTATDFAPYSKTDYPINLGDIELCKINTYKDYFHKDSGKWYVHKERGKYEVLSENIIDVQDVYTNVKYFDFPKPTDDASRGNYNVSNVLYTNAIYQYVYPFDTLVGIGKIIPNASKNNYRVGFKKGTTLTEAQEKLTNSILYYTLATPTETEITNATLIEQLEAISKAKSVKDKIYITQTNDELPFILDAEAIKEYEVN